MNAYRRRETCEQLAVKLWEWRDPRTIPPRPWLLGNALMRGELTALGGLGGWGKTALNITTMLSSISGRNLIGQHPHRKCRWLYLHLEESDDEFERRLAAAMIYHDIPRQEIEGALFHQAEGLTIAHDIDGEFVVNAPLIEAMQEYIERHEIDVVSVDPYIASYQGPENLNETQDRVIRAWKNGVAIPGRGTAVLLSHHFRKGPAEPGNADAFRGGRAFVDAARAAFTLNPMSEQEAKLFGLEEEERRRLIRLDDAKMNMALVGRERWYRLASVELGNGTEAYAEGDNVQAIAQWFAPSLFDGLSPSRAREVVQAIDAGLPDGYRYTDAKRSAGTRWAGNLVMKMTDMNEDQAAAILKQWLRTGTLEARDYKTPDRKTAKGLWANQAKMPGTVHDF